MPFAEVSDQIGQIVSGVAEFYQACEEIADLVANCVELQYEINKYIKHIHRSHFHKWHDLKHTGENVSANTPSGGSFGCRYPAPTDLLLIELYSQQDLDRNDLIYGKDFLIDDNDPNKPDSLIEAERSLQRTYNMVLPLAGKIISFVDHLDNMGWEQRGNPIAFNGKIVKQIVTGGAYGKDYIIDPNDPEKPDILKEMEQYIDPLPSKKISYSDLLRLNGYKKEQPISTPVKECGYVCTRLLGEWLHSFDIDGNGLIYGTDFILATGDPMKCRCLYDIESDRDWNPSDKISVFSWEEFCQTFPDNNPDDRW